MRKTKLIFIISILSFISIIGNPMLKPVNASSGTLIYEGVSINLTNSSEMVPVLNINVDHVFDVVSGYNVNNSNPAIQYNYVIYSYSTRLAVLTGPMNSNNDSFSVSVPLYSIPDGKYYIGLNFTANDPGYPNNNTFFDTSQYIFTLQHTLDIKYVVSLSKDGNYMTIDCTNVNSTYIKDPAATNFTITSATYHIEKNGREILNGNLKYMGVGHFEASDISLKWKGTGNYSVWVEFKYVEFANSVNTQSQAGELNHWQFRNAPLENMLFYILIIIGAAVVVILLAVFYAKRSSASITKRKSTKKQGKQIEVIDLKKSNVQKLNVENLTKKEKGKTKISKDLIFAVPQWEEEDLVGNEQETEMPTTEQPKTTIYSLHCPKCNSWYEIDDFAEIKCPKCKSPLSLAMYCSNEDKWFDVPKPGDYKCPSCNEPLKLSK